MLQRRKLAMLAVVAASLLNGCAMYDQRREYSPFTAILTPYDWNIIDWRFPTTVSEGPLEGPKRYIPELPAIGVPWATGNPLAPPPDYRSALPGDVQPNAQAALETSPVETSVTIEPSKLVAAAEPSLVDSDDQGCANACNPQPQAHVAARSGARADRFAASR